MPSVCHTQLSRLVQLDLREIWQSEPQQFTPWLAVKENLDLLGDKLGIELELESREKDVGPYRADLVCREVGTDNWVLVENQLEASNHVHLGQILTYAAGLNAVTIAWIARRFTDEHRAALDWLNEISADDIQFFGLEIEVFRIGDSLPAPDFKVVSKPNSWTKGGRARPGNLSPAKRFQLDFWTGFREHVKAHGSPISPPNPGPQNWMRLGLGKTRFYLFAYISTGDADDEDFSVQELRAEVAIDDLDHAHDYFDQLLAEQADIESQIGHALEWIKQQNRRRCRIVVRQLTSAEAFGTRDEQYAWLLEMLEGLHNAFAQRIQELEPR